MSGANLLVIGEPNTFAFEHMMAHRNYFAVMSPLTRFSILPYLLDPMLIAPTLHPPAPIPPGPMPPAPLAGMWSLNHQSAHDDALNNIPSEFGAPRVGLAVGQILMDTDLTIAGQRAWWTFQNFMEHYIANAVVLPTPPPETVPPAPPGPSWVFPFW